MSTKHQGKIPSILQAISIIPLLFFGIILMLLASHQFTSVMYGQVAEELRNISENIETLLDLAYPGDYTLTGEDAYQLYKGTHNITSDYSLIDRVKEDTGLEITLFYQDTRILTTLYSSSGSRIVGSGAPPVVINDVLKGGKAHFYPRTIINGSDYFAYYTPLQNSDGSTVGMLFVGKPSQKVDKAIQRSIYPLAIADILVMLIIAAGIFAYTKNFSIILLKIRNFLGDVSTGNLNTRLDEGVLKRNDELGDIGRSALSMQHSLRHMIEQDTLTELFNRRSADRKLRQLLDKASKQGLPFSLSIGDIDFFKRVNDTYGHDCGDIVLKSVADTLREYMNPLGFVARWGGEEFLLVFDHMNAYEAYECLSELSEKIRNLKISYNGEAIHITMTFGLTDGYTTDLQQLLKAADDKLYEGKSNGRDQIIVQVMN